MSLKHSIRFFSTTALFIFALSSYLFPSEGFAFENADHTCARFLKDTEELLDVLWTPPPPILEIFRDMKVAKDRSSIHPDKVHASDVDKLAPGTIIFLDTTGIKTSALKNQVPRTIRFEVKSSGPGILQIYNPQYGVLTFDKNSISDLYGNLYWIRRFKHRSPFLPGEFVQLGWLGLQRPAKDLSLVDLETGEIYIINRHSLPWVAKFIRVLSSDEYEVEFPRSNIQTSQRFRIHKSQVFHMNIGNGRTLKAVLQPLREIEKSFFIGESIRFRDEDGYIRQGQIIDAQNEKFLVQHKNTWNWLLKDEIFKMWAKDKPASIEVNVSKYVFREDTRIDLHRPSGFLKDVLNGAANLSSHPSFLTASFFDQLNMLVLFEHIILPWKRAGATLESTGILSFSEILCSGAGVCRHNTPLMAAILSEAGLNVRIYFRAMDGTELENSNFEFRGHTWLEVDSLTGQTFIVDPSGSVVKSLDDVHKEARSNPESADALWWGNPNRQKLLFYKKN